MTTAIWHTNADGTTVGWDGIGGTPFYAPDTATGALRLPDLRGMYAEAAGFDSLGVGGVDGDRMRSLTARLTTQMNYGAFVWQPYGIFYNFETTTDYNNYSGVAGAVGREYTARLGLDASRQAPTGSAFAPRRWGALACVYMGQPA